MSNDLDRRLLLGSAGLAGIAALAAASKAGPLNPPAGTVAGTGKTLDQVEPKVIVESLATGTGFRQLSGNSYKLTGNNDIPIEFSSRVTLDMGGFRLAPPSAIAATTGFSGASQVVIRNGLVNKRFFFSGSNAPTDAVYEEIVFENADVYIGANSIVRNCVFVGCRLFTGSGCLVESCVFRDSATLACGLTAGDRCHVRDVSIVNTLGTQSSLIVGNASIVESCRVNTPNAAAFRCGTGCVVRGCVAEQGVPGFDVGSGSTISDCVVEGFAGGEGTFCFVLAGQAVAERCRCRMGNGGFSFAEDAVVRDCLAFGSVGAGFAFGAGAIIEGCAARQCGGVGFQLANSSRIERCIAVANAGGGYRITSDTLAHGNHADSNTGVAFLVTSSDNRIESNSVSDGAGTSVGVQVDASGNLVIGNSVSGCTTAYAIAAGNAAGPIVAAAGVATNTVATANYSF